MGRLLEAGLAQGVTTSPPWINEVLPPSLFSAIEDGGTYHFGK
jgi:hypothetical protein